MKYRFAFSEFINACFSQRTLGFYYYYYYYYYFVCGGPEVITLFSLS
jgi:hypothetical protein